MLLHPMELEQLSKFLVMTKETSISKYGRNKKNAGYEKDTPLMKR